MINEFLQYLQYEKNYSSHTVLSYHTDLIQFCKFLDITPDRFDPLTIDSLKIQQWVLALMNDKLSARSLSRKISTLKSFWRFSLKRGYVKHNPTLIITLPKTKKPLPVEKRLCSRKLKPPTHLPPIPENTGFYTGKCGSDSCHRFCRPCSISPVGTRYLVWRTLPTYDA